MTKKSQELKEKIIKKISTLSIDPLGSYVSADELSKKTYNSYNDYYFDKVKELNIDEGGILSEQDHQDIIRCIIEEIKQNPNEWKLDNSGELRLVIHCSGRKHYEKGFEKEEWKEIKNALNNQQDTPSIPSSSEWQSQQEQPPKEIKYMGHIYYRGSKF